MRAVFFSDVHLNRHDKGRLAKVEAFLADVCAGADLVVALGDLFEFYHGYRNYIYPWYLPVAKGIKRLTEAGTRFYLIEGNHEFVMGRYFETYTGARCLGELTVQVDGLKVFLTHGHTLEGLLLARLLKSRIPTLAMDILGPRLTWNVAALAGTFLSQKNKGADNRAIGVLREKARKQLGEGFDAVILAHSHLADRAELQTDSVTGIYLNTGDFGREGTYVEYVTNLGFQLKRYTTGPDRRGA